MGRDRDNVRADVPEDKMCRARHNTPVPGIGCARSGPGTTHLQALPKSDKVEQIPEVKNDSTKIMIGLEPDSNTS